MTYLPPQYQQPYQPQSPQPPGHAEGEGVYLVMDFALGLALGWP